MTAEQLYRNVNKIDRLWRIYVAWVVLTTSRLYVVRDEGWYCFLNGQPVTYWEN